MIKRIISKIAKASGYELHRFGVHSNPAYQLFKGLERFKVDLVLDVGANVGQFASELRSVGYRGNIVSFEPLADAYRKLSTSAGKDSKWLVHDRCAVGDHNGEIQINIAGKSASSSVLPMLDAHTSAAPGAAYIGSEDVPIVMLDSVVPQYLDTHSQMFIKIDTQGFEWQVLDGARETLKRAQGVQCELSLVPLYEGQYLWMDMIERLNSEGFTLWAIQKGFTDPRDGRTLQVDAVFFRTTERIE